MFPIRLAVLAISVCCLVVSAAAQTQDKATFEIELDITWSSKTNPLAFPPGAHMSGLIGATHNGRHTFFLYGYTASSGVERVAENGRPAILKAEMSDAQRRGRIDRIIEGGGLRPVPGRIKATFTAGSNHPLLSFMTMIAPGPDWFTGAADILLRHNGVWINEKKIVLWAWDAGTDSGDTYLAEDADTQPRQNIRLLATRHFL